MGGSYVGITEEGRERAEEAERRDRAVVDMVFGGKDSDWEGFEVQEEEEFVLQVHDGLKVVQWADTTRSGRGPGFAANLPDLGDRAVRPRFCDRPNRARQEGRLYLVGFHRIVINR